MGNFLPKADSLGAQIGGIAGPDLSLIHIYLEARAAVRAAYAHKGPVYLRFSRLATPSLHDANTYTFEIGKGEVLCDEMCIRDRCYTVCLICLGNTA